jgi:hypothetical protein
LDTSKTHSSGLDIHHIAIDWVHRHYIFSGKKKL